MISFEHITQAATRATGLLGIPIIDNSIIVDDTLQCVVSGNILVYRYFSIRGHFVFLEVDNEIDVCRDFDEIDRYLTLFNVVINNVSRETLEKEKANNE